MLAIGLVMVGYTNASTMVPRVNGRAASTEAAGSAVEATGSAVEAMGSTTGAVVSSTSGASSRICSTARS